MCNFTNPYHKHKNHDRLLGKKLSFQYWCTDYCTFSNLTLLSNFKTMCILMTGQGMATAMLVYRIVGCVVGDKDALMLWKQQANSNQFLQFHPPSMRSPPAVETSKEDSISTPSYFTMRWSHWGCTWALNLHQLLVCHPWVGRDTSLSTMYVLQFS